jgi:ppGpp synthetase/RelA/SpoT-type nucleotidyltranferase
VPASNSHRDVARALAASLPQGLRAEDEFSAWFEPLKRRTQIATQEVHDAVNGLLAAEAARIHAEEDCERKVYELVAGGGSLTKSARSIHSKIGRELGKTRKGRGPRLTLRQVHNLILRFPDLGRFRIVCSLSCDVERALRVLLGADRQQLAGRYPLVEAVKDYVEDLSRRSPSRGHRAKQFTVGVQTGQGTEVVRVEIQLMTTVQHAWDQRNHPVYEWTREGETLPDHLVIRDVALAETLYLVDEQASRNWQDVLAYRKGNR